MNKMTDALGKFSEQFERFNQADEKRRVEFVSQDRKLQNMINENERSREDAVISTYKAFLSPYAALGSASQRAKQIETDEQNLLEAYRFWKSVSELNGTSSCGTFVKDFKIESPLSKRDAYTRGTLAIYLKSWFILEKQIEDFVPVFVKTDDGTFFLTFEELNNPFTSPTEIEIFNIIRKHFYS